MDNVQLIQDVGGDKTKQHNMLENSQSSHGISIGNPVELVKYLHGIAAKYQITDKVQLETDVTELQYIDRESQWEITLSQLAPGTGDLSEVQRLEMFANMGKKSVYIKEEKVRAKIVVSCVGILVEPNAWPTSIPGREIFRGEIFHSSRWRDSIDFRAKDVVVVGSGCRAVQVVPSLFGNLLT